MHLEGIFRINLFYKIGSIGNFLGKEGKKSDLIPRRVFQEIEEREREREKLNYIIIIDFTECNESMRI